MSNLPDDVASQVLDAVGSDYVLGTLRDGEREAQVLLRCYGQCRDQLLRSANWAFARKEAKLLLLADATGQTAGVGSVVPSGYTYEYLYPSDCEKVRFVRWNHETNNSYVPSGNIAIPQGVPIMPNLGTPNVGSRIVPARFVVGFDPNYAAQPGQNAGQTQGQSPAGSVVILTNVKNAHCTYTAKMIYPSTWDSLFRAALVSYMASEVALALTKDKALGMRIRDEQIMIAKAKLEQARLVDGNEGITSSDIPVDWMQGRRAGPGPGWGTMGYGQSFGSNYGGMGYDSCVFADGSAY